jgi:hypothetical protein
MNNKPYSMEKEDQKRKSVRKFILSSCKEKINIRQHMHSIDITEITKRFKDISIWEIVIICEDLIHDIEEELGLK